MRQIIMKQPVMPTGPNPVAPLDEFTTRKTRYNLSTQLPYGLYEIGIDLKAGVGFFEHINGMYRGQFWLADGVYLGSDHMLPRDVQTSLSRACIVI